MFTTDRRLVSPAQKGRYSSILGLYDTLPKSTRGHMERVSVCLDNFGSVNSPLNLLKDYSIDRIKIDRSFIARNVVNEEGIETEAQIKWLLQTWWILSNLWGLWKGYWFSGSDV